MFLLYVIMDFARNTLSSLVWARSRYTAEKLLNASTHCRMGKLCRDCLRTNAPVLSPALALKANSSACWRLEWGRRSASSTNRLAMILALSLSVTVLPTRLPKAETGACGVCVGAHVSSSLSPVMLDSGSRAPWDAAGESHAAVPALRLFLAGGGAMSLSNSESSSSWSLVGLGCLVGTAAACALICSCIPSRHAIMAPSACCMTGSRDPVGGVQLLGSGSGSDSASADLNLPGFWVFLTGRARPFVIRPMMLQVSVVLNIVTGYQRVIKRYQHSWCKDYWLKTNVLICTHTEQ